MPDGGRHPVSETQVSTFVPGQDDSRAFRDALGRFATGVTVITTMTDKGPIGITANSFASVSLDPPLVLWSPARTSRRFAAFAEAQRFAIHVLAADQPDVCNRFAKDGYDFDGLDWVSGAAETPLIRNCLARFECTQHATHDGGDHLIIIGRVEAAEFCDGEPLLFSRGAFGRFTDAS